LSGLIAGFILFLTVSTATVIGIVAAYGLFNAILYTFAQQSWPRHVPPVLVAGETHAGGD